MISAKQVYVAILAIAGSLYLTNVLARLCQ